MTFVSPDDVAALEAAVTDETAAIIAEPIQGEGGVRPLPAAFAEAVARVTRRTGTLLIADEIQCGLGRTGHAFHYQAFGWEPDLVTVGKAIGSGVPTAPPWSPRRWRRRSPPATTAPPTAATCWRRAPPCTCSSG